MGNAGTDYVLAQRRDIGLKPWEARSGDLSLDQRAGNATLEVDSARTFV
jgi:hypothetical protein